MNQREWIHATYEKLRETPEAANLGLTQEKVKVVLETALRTIVDGLDQDGTFDIEDLGLLRVAEQAVTGFAAPAEISATPSTIKVVVWRASGRLKRYLNRLKVPDDRGERPRERPVEPPPLSSTSTPITRQTGTQIER